MSDNWDFSVDVLVVGSGNGGMTAALCNYEMGSKDVLVIEKSEKFGGCSAISGGGVWIPNNRYAKAEGADDSADDAMAYLDAVIPEGSVPKPLIETYLENGPKMVDFLHERTHVRYESLEHYPDYYSFAPGAKAGHRSMEPAKFDSSELGEDWDKLEHSHHMMWMFDKVAFNQVEANTLAGRLPGWIGLTAKLMLQWVLDIPWRLKSHRSRIVCTGSAGVGRLRLSMKDRDIPLWLNTAMKELITDDNGKVIGAIAEKEGQVIRIQARKAVVLASGGFEHNQAMREEHLPQPTNEDWSAGHFGNTGDGLKAGIAVGGDTAMMDGAWWCTTIQVPGEPRPRLSIMEKSLPGNVLVNPAGKRLGNESQNYMAYQIEWHKKHGDDNPCIPAYSVFDSRYRNSYLVGPIIGNMTPDWTLPLAEWEEQGFFYKADSLEELAQKAGIDKEGLLETVNEMNGYAITGDDTEYERGKAEYDRYYGDPTITPNPCLAEIKEAPFYAMRQDPGDFGTHGGLCFNQNGQILKSDGQPIEGLYGCGNTVRAILPNYPGPGATLGPAMTFAYQGAKHVNSFQD